MECFSAVILEICQPYLTTWFSIPVKTANSTHLRKVRSVTLTLKEGLPD